MSEMKTFHGFTVVMLYYLASLAMYHSDVVGIMFQPILDIVTELADDFELRRMVVIKRKVFDTSMKTGFVVSPLRATASK